MSVLTSHLSSQFFLPVRHKEEALHSLQNFIRKAERPGDYVFEADAVLKACTLPDALHAAGLRTSEDDEGNLVSLQWILDSLPRDVNDFAQLLNCLARYVRAESYIELEEEFSPCKFRFKDQSVRLYCYRYDAFGGYLARASRALEAGDPKKALDELAHTTREHPERCMGWVETAKACARLQMWDRAEQACFEAAAASVKVHDGGTYKLDYSQTAFPALSYNADYIVGEHALECGQLAVAIPFLQRAGQALPKEDTIFWKWAEALHRLRRYGECLEVARKLLNLNAAHSYGLYHAAYSLYQLGRSQEALQYAALVKDTKSWFAPLCLHAEIAKDAGHPKKAVQVCEKIRKQATAAIEKFGDASAGWYRAYLAHALLILEQWQDAQHEAKQACVQLGNSPYVLNILGVALLMQGDVEQAAPIFEKAMQLDSAWESPKYNLAECRLKLQRTEEAANLHDKALAISPRLAKRPPFDLGR